MKIIFSEKCLGYRRPLHPESPGRVDSVYRELYRKGRFEFVSPRPCSEEDILLVHTRELLSCVKKGSFSDPDTPNLPGIFEHAKLSAGAAILAAEFALKGEKAFSLMRPPGHHAGRDFLGGFCYFNNMAIAIEKALTALEKVAIVDFDCHHGNGTEDIFWGNRRLLYISLHQSPLYPGTGLKSRGNCLNYPLPAQTDQEIYLKVFGETMKKIQDFSPRLLGISAGFDAYRKDPLTNMGLEIETFEEIGREIASLNVPSFALLEGGYSEELPQCVWQFLVGWGGKI
jgi:acetoin utilization deacetylase AcuC-like enzyme